MNGNGEEQQIRVRGERQPGHCWQDNELYCCFGPVIGMDAVAVYGQLSVREENGRAAFSLRDMGRWLDKSKDTVKRAIAVLELVGLIRATDELGARGIATFTLVNLKDLAESYGAIYDRNLRSYAMPREAIAGLRLKVAELRRALARQKPTKASSVANSDSGAFFAQPANCDRSGADSDTSVANSDSQPFIEEKDKDNHPLPPPSAEGVQEKCVSIDSAEKPAEPREWDALKRASSLFTAVHDAMRGHLLNDRPKNARPDLASGFDDWRKFALDDLAVQSAMATRRGWVLVIDSPDAEATRAGLAKYCKTWEGALREWYGSVASVTVVQRVKAKAG